MISLLDVTSGRVSLAEIVEINHYLTMKSDIEYYASEKMQKEREQKNGRKSR